MLVDFTSIRFILSFKSNCPEYLYYPQNPLEPEQDHRGVKRITNAALGYKSFYTANRTIRGIEIMRMIYKGQGSGVNSKDVLGEKNFIDSLFGIAV